MEGTTVAGLGKIPDAKGERYVFHQLTKGQSATEALSEKLPEIIAGIHFPKTMYWTGKGGSAISSGPSDGSLRY